MTIAPVLKLTPGIVTENFLALNNVSFAPIDRAYTHPQTPNIYPELRGLQAGRGPMMHEITEPAVLLCGGPHGADSYWHWLIDYLPRASLVPGDLPLVVNDDLSPVQMTTLSAYYDGRSWIRKTPGERLQFRTLYVPPFLSDTGFVRPEAIDFLRRLWPYVGKPHHAPERVYLSRRGVTARALSYERELEAALFERGFKIAVPHEMTFFQQVDLMASARVVVAPHGGAMANLSFARRGVRFLEIMTKPTHTAGPSICEAAGHEHIPVSVGSVKAVIDAL